MELSLQFIQMLNIFLILLFVVTILKAYKIGFLASVFELIATIILMIVAMPISKLFVNITLISVKIDNASDVVVKLIQSYVNQMIGYVIIVLIGFIVFKFIFKSMNKLPIFGKLNKLLGALFGICMVFVYTFIILMIANSGLIKNKEAILQQTVIKYTAIPIEVISKKENQPVLNYFVVTMKDISQQLSTTDYHRLIDFFKDNGVVDIVSIIQQIKP